MIDKKTVRKMLENRACDGVDCVQCPIKEMQLDKDRFFKWTRCCEKNDDEDIFPVNGCNFRPRVIRLLTEWLAEQEGRDVELILAQRARLAKLLEYIVSDEASERVYIYESAIEGDIHTNIDFVSWAADVRKALAETKGC